MTNMERAAKFYQDAMNRSRMKIGCGCPTIHDVVALLNEVRPEMHCQRKAVVLDDREFIECQNMAGHEAPCLFEWSQPK